jgi:hypothetical protein
MRVSSAAASVNGGWHIAAFIAATFYAAMVLAG